MVMDISLVIQCDHRLMTYIEQIKGSGVDLSDDDKVFNEDRHWIA